MKRLLFAWLGKTDLAAVDGTALKGPILEVVSSRPFDELHILADCPAGDAARYQNCLYQKSSIRIERHPIRLSSPTCHRDTYETVVATRGSVLSGRASDCQATF